MAIVNVHNKARNVTYVYDSVSYWDKELKQPRSKRKLIGKRDPVTNEIIPTGRRGRKKGVPNSSAEKPTVHSDRSLELKYQKCLDEIREKDATILEQRQQIASIKSRLRSCLTILKQLQSAITRTVSENDING